MSMTKRNEMYLEYMQSRYSDQDFLDDLRQQLEAEEKEFYLYNKTHE